MDSKTYFKLLTYARHKHVYDRYNYWANVKRRREDDIFKILAYKECFYSERMIYDIMLSFKPDPELDNQINELLKDVL